MACHYARKGHHIHSSKVITDAKNPHLNVHICDDLVIKNAKIHVSDDESSHTCFVNSRLLCEPSQTSFVNPHLLCGVITNLFYLSVAPTWSHHKRVLSIRSSYVESSQTCFVCRHLCSFGVCRCRRFGGGVMLGGQRRCGARRARGRREEAADGARGGGGW